MTPRKKTVTSQQRRWADLRDASVYFGVSVDTLKRRIADGSVKAYRMPGGKSIRVDLNEMDASMVSVPSAVRP